MFEKVTHLFFFLFYFYLFFVFFYKGHLWRQWPRKCRNWFHYTTRGHGREVSRPPRKPPPTIPTTPVAISPKWTGWRGSLESLRSSWEAEDIKVPKIYLLPQEVRVLLSNSDMRFLYVRGRIVRKTKQINDEVFILRHRTRLSRMTRVFPLRTIATRSEWSCG